MKRKDKKKWTKKNVFCRIRSHFVFLRQAKKYFEKYRINLEKETHYQRLLVEGIVDGDQFKKIWKSVINFLFFFSKIFFFRKFFFMKTRVDRYQFTQLFKNITPFEKYSFICIYKKFANIDVRPVTHLLKEKF